MSEQKNKKELPEGALEVLLKEHAFLKDEVKERLKTAFSHVAYAGAIVAFGIPAADKVADWIPSPISILTLLIGICAVCWVAFLNMRWVQHCGIHLKKIEDRINLHFGNKILGWEAYAASVAAKQWFLFPKKPKSSENKQAEESALGAE